MSKNGVELTKIRFGMKNGKMVNVWYEVPKMECPQFVTPGDWGCKILQMDTDTPYIVIAGVRTQLTKVQAEVLLQYKRYTWGAKMLNDRRKFQASIARMPD